MFRLENKYIFVDGTVDILRKIHILRMNSSLFIEYMRNKNEKIIKN